MRPGRRIRARTKSNEHLKCRSTFSKNALVLVKTKAEQENPCPISKEEALGLFAPRRPKVSPFNKPSFCVDGTPKGALADCSSNGTERGF